MIFWALLAAITIPITATSAYMGIYYYKESKLLKLFLVITKQSSGKATKERTADQAIEILHKNKRIVSPKPIAVNIRNPKGATLAFYLFKAEIRYLLNCIDKRRNQKKYLSSLTARSRSGVLKFIDDKRRFLELIDLAYLDFEIRALFLNKIYRQTALMYRQLPDKNDYPEISFHPLFEIIDKTPSKTVRLLPYFPT